MKVEGLQGTKDRIQVITTVRKIIPARTRKIVRYFFQKWNQFSGLDHEAIEGFGSAECCDFCTIDAPRVTFKACRQAWIFCGRCSARNLSAQSTAARNSPEYSCPRKRCDIGTNGSRLRRSGAC